MTVDEILATGQYTDRRGRVWLRCPLECFLVGGWFCRSAIGPARPRVDWHSSESDMRLLIERDQHRAVCEGIAFCESHPVYRVVIYDPGEFVIFVPFDSIPLSERETLPEAIDSACWLAESDAARALAVGE